MSEFSQQFTIPYAKNINILTGADFTVDTREKIYLRDDKNSNRYVILFYREKDADITKLRSIQKIFIDTGSQKFPDVSLNVCNLSADTTLDNAFNEVRKTQAHPFNWIQNAADPNIFILIYYSGYPQMFYEGPLEKGPFSDFITTYLSVDELESKIIFKKYNSGNGFTTSGDSRKTYIEQAWGKYVPSGGVNVADALIKTENIPLGLRAIAKGEYIGPPPGTLSSQLPSRSDELNNNVKKEKIKSWTEKINKKNGKNKELEPVINKIPTEVGNSPYIDYLISYKSGNKSDNGLQDIVYNVYEVAKKLFSYRDAYGITANDVAILAVNMVGFYNFKVLDPTVKVDTADELEAVYISQNIVSKFVNINPVFSQQISKNVANIILSDDGTIKTAKRLLEAIFNNKENTNAGKKNLDLDDAKIIVNYFKDKMDELVNNEDNKSKSKEEKLEIKKDPDNYDTNEESFPFKNYEVNDKTNIQFANLIDNNDNLKKRIIAIIIKDTGAPQQQGGQQSSGGGGTLGSSGGGGGGRRGRRGS